MFRSQIDHHQGDKIFFLTSVTKFNFIDVAACSMQHDGQSMTETCRRSFRVLNNTNACRHAAASIKLNLITEVKTNILSP